MATLALTMLTYAHTAISQVVHVRLPHLALAHLPSCQVHLLGEAFSISGNLAQAAHTAYTRRQASMQQPCTQPMQAHILSSCWTVKMHSFRDLCLRVADRVEPDYCISVSDMTCCKGHQSCSRSICPGNILPKACSKPAPASMHHKDEITACI